jgi:preprotein translocase subunit SecF
MKFSVNRQRRLWWAISSGLIVVGLVAMVISWQQFQAPLRPGLDFVGGTRLQFSRDCTVDAACDQPIDSADVRQVLTDQGLEDGVIQILGDDRQSLSIRTGDLELDVRSQLQAALEAELGQFDPLSTQIDTVGPVIGRQLFASGMLALLVAFAGIVAYLSLRFQFDYAVFAIVALLHDLLITLGVFSVLGLVINVEVDSLFIVALLTTVGLSVNDTVVVYDRVRENLSLTPQRHISDVVDDAINQTLGRSINTTLTTVLTLLAIVLFGGQTLKFFALAMIVGFIAGAYSSIFIASTLLTFWRERSGRAILPVSEPEEPEDAPISDTAEEGIVVIEVTAAPPDSDPTDA